MKCIEDKFRKDKIEFMNSMKDSISTSQFRKVEILPNGDKFVHDLSAGYIIDGVTEQIKGWEVKVGNIGGPCSWAKAEYGWNGIIGPDGRNGLYPEPQKPFRVLC